MSFINPSTLCNLTIIAILTSPLFTSNHFFVRSTITHSIISDKEALISFRSQLTLDSSNPSNPLSSWDQNSSPCNWTRVQCNKLKTRVIGLNLSSLQLTGSISPYIGNLTFLKSLQLQNNKLNGIIPNEISNLLNLKLLNLSSNIIEGPIPLNITNLRELTVIDLTMNNISGSIPSKIDSLQKLQVLNLAKNLISGLIPKSIGNISALITLDIDTNTLSGSIPNELSRLTRLNHLDLSINNLTGLVPPSIYNMSSLSFIALASNELMGELPYDVGKTLPNLRVFYFCINKFTGRIPGSLHNLPNIEVIRMAHNRLTGTIPPGLGNLPFLKMYNIGYNQIVSKGDNGLDFIDLLSNSTRLNFLAFDGNLIEGYIPESIGNLSKTLSKLYMGSNQIRGSIPATIGQLTGLTLVNMSYNEITGQIPSQISQIRDLQVLDLANNRISGNIPESLGSLSKLDQLDLHGNNLTGEIPRSFSGFGSPSSIDLSSNMLNGSIPKEIFSIQISNSLKLGKNRFSGELPQEIGLLDTVVTVDVCDNKLSGNIPSAISNCMSLETLNMSKNSFSGPIPTSLGQLNALETLDLSENDLKGTLPCGGVFRNLSRVHLQGNPEISSRLSCQNIENNSHHHNFQNIIIIVISAFLLLLVSISSFVYVMRKRISSKSVITPSNPSMGQCELVKYEELRQATDNFNERNLIGKGGFGSVYKGIIKENMGVAIKVLDLKISSSWKSFVAECEVLRHVRHRNLVKIITCCSSLDYKNKEFVAVVYEYMSNGSLEDWLKGAKRKENGDGLGLLDRLNVMIDVASGLSYMHYDSEVAVVHCDLKPSNILLDDDLTAKVGDFGLATLLMEEGGGEVSISTSHVLKGSVGYIPPEYGLGVRPSPTGDTYSFGVTLLGMFTGKSPNHETSTGEQNLVTWVRNLFPDHVIEATLDPKLYKEVQCNDTFHAKQKDEIFEQLKLIVEVGLCCTIDHPEVRISLKDALSKLIAARKRCFECLGR